MAQTRKPRKAEGRGWPRRGEIYLTALDPTVGHEIKKTRPALVIQNDTSNRYSAVTMVAPITSTVRLPLSPLHVLLPANSSTGLIVASVAVFNQVRAVDHKRLIEKLGEVDALALAQVDEAIEAAFGLSSSGPGLSSPQVIAKAISEGAGDTKTGRYEG
jgi:mRNA interferase MazF